MTKAVRDRPQIPSGYGISEDAEGLLEWSKVVATIDGADIYWVATSNPNGEPHLVPLHAAAVDGTVYLSGDAESRWVKNLGARPTIRVGINHNSLQVIIRGTASTLRPDAELWKSVRANIGTKYEWQFGDEPLHMWPVRATSAIAFDAAEFATSPTRFTFEERP